MKIKNIHFIERHIEKIILGACALFGLVILWFFVLDSPYTTKILNEEGIGPDRVPQLVRKQADDIFADITNPKSPLPSIPVPPYTSMFRERVERKPLSVASLDPLSHPGLAGPFQFEEPVQKRFHLPTPPAPDSLVATHSYGVLPDQDALAEQLAQRDRLASSLAAATATASRYSELVPVSSPRDFRYVSVAAAFDWDAWRERLRESGDGTVPVPEIWWRNTLMLTDVILERQRLDSLTNEWGPTETIAALPEAMNLRQAHDTWLSNEAQEVVQIVRDRQKSIARPPFVPMTTESTWQAPDTGIDPQDTPVPAVGNTARPGTSDDALVTAPRFQEIWAHDLTVQPGRTYRYRLRALVYNPLFQKRRLMDDQRETYFHKLSLESQPSDWTDPIDVDPEHWFFAVKGSERSSTATIEVWRVFDGRPRVQEFEVTPGDTIGGQIPIDTAEPSANLDLRVESMVVDIVRSVAGAGFDSDSLGVLYIDLATNELHTRNIAADQASPIRARLREQAEAVTVAASD